MLKQSVFFRYMLTYMLVSVITVAFFSSFLYLNNVKGVRDDLIAEYENVLENESREVNDNIARLYDLTVILQSRQLTQQVRRIRSFSAKNVSEINAFANELQPYSFVMPYTEALILYFAESDLFISSQGIGIYPNVYYETVMQYKEMNFPEWKKLAEMPHFMNYYRHFDSRTGKAYIDILIDFPNTNQRNKILMIARIPADKMISGSELENGEIFLLQDSDGNIIYTSKNNTGESKYQPSPPPVKADQNIDAENIAELLDNTIDETNIHIPDTLEKENVLTISHSGQSVELDGDKYVAFTAHLQSAKWNYSLLVPEKIFFAAQKEMQNTVIALIISILGTGIILSGLMSFMNIRPIYNLLDAFGVKRKHKLIGGGNEYVNLNSHIQTLIESNRNLKSDLERYAELSRISFMDRLLKTGIFSAEELYESAEYFGIMIKCKYYMIAVFELTGYNNELINDFLPEIDTLSSLLTDFFREHTSKEVLVHKADFNHIALVFGSEQENLAVTVKKEVENLYAQVGREMDIHLRAAVSDMIPDLNMLSYVYHHVYRHLRNTTVVPECPVDYLQKTDNRQELYYYPLDLENRLLGNILAGNLQEAGQLLRFLYDENMEHFRIAPPNMKHFFAAVQNSLLRVKNEIEWDRDDIVFPLESGLIYDIGANPEQQFEQLLETVKLLCTVELQKKEDRNGRLIENINRYIEENYQNDQLDLSMIAEKFMLTGNYLSFFYRNQTGEKISGMIEKIRLRNAEILLKEGLKTIKDIAFTVGYQNLNTFYKAFRRVYGISPRGYYDKIHRMEI